MTWWLTVDDVSEGGWRQWWWLVADRVVWIFIHSMKLNKKMLKIRFEFNRCTHVKILLVKYKVKQEK